MDFTESLIKKYAKKILGFAYSKTKNYHNAEDLSQNILLALLKIDFSNKAITDMNGYVFRVCQYTWSNYVRKNKHYWEGVTYNDDILPVIEENTENKIIKKKLYEKLRREITRLSKTKREITIMFYYENKSGKEISKILGIPASTVRWYLFESKKLIKEHIEMTETIYNPKRLTVYFCGSSPDFSLHGLRNDLLVQNICFACREKALTIEEIAAALSMAASYIEDKLEPLLNMNYIKKVRANKYQTTFFIQDENFVIAKKKFEYENLPQLAKAIFNAVKDNLSKIRNIGFTGADLDENFLLWALITKIAHDLLCDISIKIKAQPPIRGDGSSHWIDASICEKDILKSCSSLDEGLKNYILYSGGYGARYSGNEFITAQQFDMKFAGAWRGFFDNEVRQIKRIYTIIKQSLAINELDKESIAYLANMGYVKMSNEKPKILIPYLNAAENTKLNNIIQNIILPQIKENTNINITQEYTKYISKFIPKYISNDEKKFVVSRFYPPCSVSWLLMKEGYLTEPTKEEKKRLCTIIWENK